MAHGIAGGANTRQHDGIGRGDGRRVVRNGRLMSERNQRLTDTVNIARVVINDD